MSLDSKKIIKLSQEAKKLVENVDDDIKFYTYQVVFSKLLDDNYSAPYNVNKVTSPNKSKGKTSIQKGPNYQLKILISEGFFTKQRTIPDILADLTKKSFHYKHGDLTRPLEALCQDRVLRREQKKLHGNKSLWHYSNW